MTSALDKESAGNEETISAFSYPLADGRASSCSHSAVPLSHGATTPILGTEKLLLALEQFVMEGALQLLLVTTFLTGISVQVFALAVSVTQPSRDNSISLLCSCICTFSIGTAMIVNLVLYFAVRFGGELYEAYGPSSHDRKIFRARHHFRLFLAGVGLILVGCIALIAGFITHLHDTKREVWTPFIIYFLCGTASMAGVIFWFLYVHHDHKFWMAVWTILIWGDLMSNPFASYKPRS